MWLCIFWATNFFQVNLYWGAPETILWKIKLWKTTLTWNSWSEAYFFKTLWLCLLEHKTHQNPLATGSIHEITNWVTIHSTLPKTFLLWLFSCTINNVPIHSKMCRCRWQIIWPHYLLTTQVHHGAGTNLSINSYLGTFWSCLVSDLWITHPEGLHQFPQNRDQWLLVRCL